MGDKDTSDEEFVGEPGSPTPTRRRDRVCESVRGDTTMGSPRKRRVYGDRYIPDRNGVNLQAAFSLVNDEQQQQQNAPRRSEMGFQKKEEANKTFSTLLKAELFDDGMKQDEEIESSDKTTPPRSSRSAPATPNKKNLFRYKQPATSVGERKRMQDDIYSLSPVRMDSQRLLLSPRKQPRSVSKVPYKVLDAPELEDDFYLNLVDWGSKNLLAVGLRSAVYIWKAQTGHVQHLCNLPDGDKVASVSWIRRGTHLAVGTNLGQVQIWDVDRCKRVRTMSGHDARANSLAWNEHILSSGSRDRTILHRDVRAPEHFIKRITGHRQEVCGLRWNVEENQLASGGNDNRLFVWDGLNETPLYRFDHTAAVKALAWSPHQRGLLASGAGTMDRRIRFWSTVTGSLLQEVDTGSQVCNLAWSTNSNELVSTHGYSQNQIMVWKYPSMQQVAALTGHTYRVLYLAVSPDGKTVVTGAGDETLRFWNVFSDTKQTSKSSSSILDAFQQIR
ncbi:hypothetical protein TRICI_004003 [Trichomonascus ciferrii]|uniref:CDC20/Fizzy WD40 domain-containing protein n=1 Tax=Trichomonascus ciferrii TaxID=44093 RepID=A0A642V2G6_9ASCO|nr:hypothetical protein TRICI_004003 [Trichomonascus ciferrii]